jgi:hypothetical protein
MGRPRRTPRALFYVSPARRHADCEKWLHAEHLERLFPPLGLAPLGLECGLEHLDLTPARPRSMLHPLRPALELDDEGFPLQRRVHSERA